MKELKIPEIKDTFKASKVIMLVIVASIILYSLITHNTEQEVPAKEIYEEAYNSSYSGRILEKVDGGTHWHKFWLTDGSVYIGWDAYDAAEVGDSVWKKSKNDTLYMKMPDGAVLGFDAVSNEREEYLNEIKKQH